MKLIIEWSLRETRELRRKFEGSRDDINFKKGFLQRMKKRKLLLHDVRYTEGKNLVKALKNGEELNWFAC